MGYMLRSITAPIQKICVGPLKTNNNSIQNNTARSQQVLNLDEKSIMSYSLDLICSYLVELQAVTMTSNDEKEIIQNLKKLKSTIEFCGIRKKLKNLFGVILAQLRKLFLGY